MVRMIAVHAGIMSAVLIGIFNPYLFTWVIEYPKVSLGLFITCGPLIACFFGQGK